MAKEAVKVIARRFTARMLESGLLVLAVALGVGATAAGFSLLANTQKVGAEMLASPAYREIVVATQTKADDMESPAVLKPSKDNVILTASDLSVAQSVPGVRYAYVSSGTELRFLNQKAITQMASMGPGPGGAAPAASTSTTTKSGSTTQTSAPKAASGNGGFRPPSEDDLTKAKAEADVFITDVDQLRGSAVTPQYFSAWGLKAATGSLFADSESQSDTTTLVVLGANAATQIAGTGNDPKTLVGKKILTWEGYASVVGILAVSGTDTIDNSFFTPYQTPAADSGFGPPRRMSFNVQLRFSVSNPSQLEKAAASLSSLLSQTYSTDQLVVSNPRAEAQKLIDRNTGIGVLILFLALAALFIASVNVSHILMSRGLRMRKGVGILMALGASKASVLQLFAGEGVFLSTAGSLLGALLAWPLSQTMESALGLSSSSLVFLAAGVAGAWVLNLVFSILPAVQNSQIPPADAMRAA
ncbi:MAG TPA: ABC transporter permease [Spirochaetia bacterium]|nr:ABC transporter permease [Spirochaetia bacterium]